MKRILSVILCLSLLSLSIPGITENSIASPTEINWEQEVKFTGSRHDGSFPGVIRCR